MRTLKRLGLALAIVLFALVAIVTINTLRLERQPLADAQAPAPASDPAAIGRLSAAIRIPTISTEEGPASPEAIAAFQALLERSFPRVHAELKRDAVAGGSLLYTWPGSDPNAPALLLAAHQDVVPVEAGSERDWQQPPFSGAVDGRFIWGRGAIDDKGSLMAILEAVERQLARGVTPKQTIYLAFGHDEERGGTGAAAIAALLRQRGARIGLALDEGSAVLDGVIPGVTSPISLIGVAEKGYVSVELSASGPGGHSSMPSADNAAVRIARAAARIQDKQMPAHIDGVTGAMLDGIAPYADTTLKVALANRWLTGSMVRRQFLASPQTAAAIRTTSAVTILQAGTKDNVLPQGARAVVNHRILPGDTVATVLAHDREAIGDPHVRVRALPPQQEPSRPVSTAGEEYRRLAAVIRANFPHAPTVPGLVVGATDGRRYQGLAKAVLRFSPMTMGKDDLKRFHGTNERLAIADYMRAIRFYEQLISGSPLPGNSAVKPR
jgi:carboxypeptidase PM20D1